MQSLRFWKNWLNDFRLIWFVTAGIFVFSIVFLWFNWFNGADGVIHWEHLQDQKVIESTVHSFRSGAFELSVPAENYVIIEYFNGSTIAVNKVASVVFVIVLLLCSVVFLTVITMAQRFWYFVGMGLFILFIVSLRLEVLSLFFQRNQIPLISVVILYSFLSYYFHALNASVTFPKRLLVFSAVTFIICVVVFLFSAVPYPGLHLAVTGYTVAMVLTVLFILMIAHEIPAAFVYIASQGNTKSLRHFIIINTVYLFYVIITCLHEMNVIHWNFIYINVYLLFSISAVLGLWGFKLRESLYSNIFSFSPYGAYFYAALASISFITIGQLLGSSNDPALRIITDAIIFSHVGYGVIFLTYVISNFVLMLAQNLAVYKVMYKANRMPYFTFRLGGLIAVLGFVFYSSWSEYVYNGIAGFYNNIGDLYVAIDRSEIAETYYEQGKNYGFENNHANYALAGLKSERLNLEEAHQHYKLANGSKPTVYSVVNEGNLFIWENNFFDAIKSYHKGNEKIHGSGEIENNLGAAYGRVHNIDSALVFLNKARNHHRSKASAETNFFALMAMEYLPIDSDSVLKIFENPSEATISNAIALASVQGRKFNPVIDPFAKRQLTLYTATLLSNYIVMNAKSLDSLFINKAYALASDSVNSDYSEALKSSIAFAYYHAGNVSKALKVLAELVYVSQSYQGKYNYIMGLWALEQNNPIAAASYFTYAVEANYKEGKLYQAISLSDAQRINEALIAWDTVSNNSSETQKQMAAAIKRILKTSLLDAQTFSDPEKYQFCRYRFSIKDTVAFSKFINTFENNDYKAQALLDMTRRQYEWNNGKGAIECFNKIGGLKLTDSTLYREIQHMELLMLAHQRELRTLARQINKGVSFGESKKLEKIYFTALLNEAANDTINANRNFGILGTYNPYFEEGVIAAANYFRKRDAASLKPYTLLVEAIQVNNNSVKLLRAYSEEAKRMGFTEYSESALERVGELYKKELN